VGLVGWDGTGKPESAGAMWWFGAVPPRLRARGQYRPRDANVDARGAPAACPRRRHAGAAAERWLLAGGGWGWG